MEEDAHCTYCSNSYRLGSCTEWGCLRLSFPVVLHLSPAETKDFMHLRDDVSSAALQVFGRAFPTSFNFRAVRESCLTLEGLDSCPAPPSQKGTCKTGEKAGGKRTTSLFNSCWSNNIKQRRCMFLLLPFSVASRKYGWILGQNIFVKFPVKVTESIVNFRPVWRYWGLNSGKIQKIPFCCTCWASKLLKKLLHTKIKRKYF